MEHIVTLGLPETASAIKQIAVRLDETARVITELDVALLEGQAKRNFIGSHAPGLPHVGGSSPNVASGNLRRSITHDPVQRVAPGVWGSKAGPTAVYGRRVELGYPGGSGRGHAHTRPFPYLAPAAAQTQAQMQAIALAQWARVLS